METVLYVAAVGAVVWRRTLGDAGGAGHAQDAVRGTRGAPQEHQETQEVSRALKKITHTQWVQWFCLGEHNCREHSCRHFSFEVALCTAGCVCSRKPFRSFPSGVGS